RTSNTVETSYLRRPIPLAAIVLLALIVHGPLLTMQLPLTTSYDANLHIFFASHYAHHWFDPWNEKWFAGFSQTTYPPLGHQWIAIFSYFVGLRRFTCWRCPIFTSGQVQRIPRDCSKDWFWSGQPHRCITLP